MTQFADVHRNRGANLREQAVMVRVRVADEDAEQARVKTVCQPGDIRKRDVVALSGCDWPADIQHEARSAGVQFDTVAADLGSSAMDPRAHQPPVYRAPTEKILEWRLPFRPR